MVTHALEDTSSPIPGFCQPVAREQQGFIGSAESGDKIVSDFHESRGFSWRRRTILAGG